jgi:3-isopropylmalate/(R)-2-methylmalate dehydratase small subunit
MLFEGKIWKFGDNISTDLIMPGYLMARHLPDSESAGHCMINNRPGWAQQVQKGDILVAGKNFGCGSSRPAARLLKALGISVIVADSISRLFFRNTINIGQPVLICEGVSKAFHEGDLAQVELEKGHVINLTSGEKIQGEALPLDSPPMQILKSGGLDAFMVKNKLSH